MKDFASPLKINKNKNDSIFEKGGLCSSYRWSLTRKRRQRTHNQ
jgi:hypothetical protein